MEVETRSNDCSSSTKQWTNTESNEKSKGSGLGVSVDDDNSTVADSVCDEDKALGQSQAQDKEEVEEMDLEKPNDGKEDEGRDPVPGENGEGERKGDDVMVKPKRPKSGYMHFLDQRRSSCKEQNPGAKMIDLQKIMSTEWRELSASAKKTYEDIAKKSKQEYQEKVKEYKAWLKKKQSSNKENEPSPAGNKSSLPKPKKPTSAFFQFLNKNRSAFKDKSNTAAQIVKIVSAKWKSLSDEEKKEYVELAQADKKRYKAEMEEYRKNGGTNTSGSGMGETDDPIATLFPLAKVKKVIQLDIKDRRVAKDAACLVAKCAEDFIKKISVKLQQNAARAGRKTVRIEDLQVQMRKDSSLSFLEWGLKDDIQKAIQIAKTANKRKKSSDKGLEAVHKCRKITSFFGRA